MKNFNICLAPDNDYAKQCAVVMASVVANSQPEEFIIFHILHDSKLSDSNIAKLSQIFVADKSNYEIRFLKIDDAVFEKFHNYGHVSTWYRWKISSLLPEVDRLLYLDCDIAVCASLAPLFELDMDGYCLAAVKDNIYKKFGKKLKLSKKSPYFNAGVLVMNLKYWREHNLEKIFFDYIFEDFSRTQLMDQTVMNQLFGSITKMLPLKWNFQYVPVFADESCYFADRKEYVDAVADPRIIHFFGQCKPWLAGLGRAHFLQDVYFKYLQMTSWKMSETELADFEAENLREFPKALRKIRMRALSRHPHAFVKPYFLGRIFLELYQKKSEFKNLLRALCSFKIIDDHVKIRFFGLHPNIRTKTELKFPEVSQYGCLKEPRKNGRLICSLTTIPARIELVDKVVSCLLTQSLKPDMVVLWLANEEFPEGKKSLPKSLLKLKEFGLTIKFCKNYKSYKKLIPSLREFPEDYIATFDDDIFYASDVLENLWKSSQANPHCVCCYRTGRIKLVNGMITPISNNALIYNHPHDATFKNVIMSGTGTLFPPHSLYKDILDENVFMKLMPSNDEIFFWAMAVLNGSKIVNTMGFDYRLYMLREQQKVALSHINTVGSKTGIDGQSALRLAAKTYPDIIARLRDE